jgi:CRISPR-associated protein Cas5h
VFDIQGDWAHFRRPHTASPRLTYGIPPRTTVGGLLAAIQGYPRDSYYELFHPENSDIAISVTSPVRRFMVPKNFIDTEGSSVSGSNHRKNITDNRQQIAVEYLVNPSYRVYVSVHSSTFMDTLQRRLEENRPHFTPGLGKAECLASLSYVGRFEKQPVMVDENDVVQVDSVIPRAEPNLKIDPGVNYVADKFPSFFTMTDGERVPGAWQDMTFAASGDPVALIGSDYVDVGGDVVVFE